MPLAFYTPCRASTAVQPSRTEQCLVSRTTGAFRVGGNVSFQTVPDFHCRVPQRSHDDMSDCCSIPLAESTENSFCRRSHVNILTFLRESSSRPCGEFFFSSYISLGSREGQNISCNLQFAIFMDVSRVFQLCPGVVRMVQSVPQL